VSAARQNAVITFPAGMKHEKPAPVASEQVTAVSGVRAVKRPAVVASVWAMIEAGSVFS
jgi:hypothetical protein